MNIDDTISTHLQHFRCHERGRADRGHNDAGGEHARHTEINHFHRVVVGHEKVGRFDVAMNDAELMQVRQSFRHVQL